MAGLARSTVKDHTSKKANYPRISKNTFHNHIGILLALKSPMTLGFKDSVNYNIFSAKVKYLKYKIRLFNAILPGQELAL